MHTDPLVHRLSRIQGQIEGLKKIVASGNADCLKTIELAKASSNAIKKFAQAYVEAHLEQCVQEKKALSELEGELKKVVQSTFSL
jgi:DNA-binding FrmR family transcriptional regulator